MESIIPIFSSSVYSIGLTDTLIYSFSLTFSVCAPILSAYSLRFCSIFFVLLTVFLSMRRPSKKAAKYSAIETAKYTEIKKKTTEKDIRSIRNKAKSNLQRNRKRTTLVFTSLILSVIFVNSLWIISNSFDEEKYINAQMRRDYLIASTDTLNPSVGYVRSSAA